MPRSLADDLADDVSRTFLQTDQFGEAVTRYPLGNTGSGAAVSALFDETPPNRMTDHGERVDRTGKLQIDETVDVDAKDTWLVRGEVWQVNAVESALAGLRTIHLQRADKVNTRTFDPSRRL